MSLIKSYPTFWVLGSKLDLACLARQTIFMYNKNAS